MNNIETDELKRYGLKKGFVNDTDILKVKEKIKKIPKLSLSLDLIEDERDDRDFSLNESAYDIMTSTKVDWTSKMSPVKDQGKLGSCVGFATAAMKEFQEQIEHDREVAEGKSYRREQDHYDLSEAWIYWNCKKIDPWPKQQGTSIRCAMKVLHKIGVPCEKAYPYSDKYKGEPTKWSKLIAKWGLIDSYWRCKNLNSLRLGLNSGPVVIGIYCFEEIFFVNKNGKVRYPRYPKNLLGGHAICAVGYNDKNKTIKFKNSWGKEWGKNGYGFISYKYINDFMVDAWVARDLSVTRKILNERANDELI